MYSVCEPILLAAWLNRALPACILKHLKTSWSTVHWHMLKLYETNSGYSFFPSFFPFSLFFFLVRLVWCWAKAQTLLLSTLHFGPIALDFFGCHRISRWPNGMTKTHEWMWKTSKLLNELNLFWFTADKIHNHVPVLDTRNTAVINFRQSGI